MVEARELGFEYSILKSFANDFATRSKIKDIFQVERLLELMGCQINDVLLSEWEGEKYNFVEVKNEKDFNITICSKLGQEMKRFILLQGLAHYMLHSIKGQKPCYIKSMTKGRIAREGVIFTLCLLMPDELIVNMINKGFSQQELGHFFRVPKELIGIKLELLKNIK